MMSKGKFLGALLATSVAVAASAGVNAETIKIGTEGAYPPFNYYTADGQLAGFDIEIGKALCSEMKVECEFVAQDWDGIIPALLAGKYDMILASMFITDERKQQVAFSAPYQASAMTFVVDKQSGIKDVSPEAMKGMIIGAQGSTTQAEYLLAKYPDSEVRLYPTQDAVNLDLVSGRIDAQAGDIMPMTDWLSSEDGACCEKVGNLIMDRQYVGDGVGIAFRKEDQELRQRLDQALVSIIKNGTYQKINDEFFSINLLTLK